MKRAARVFRRRLGRVGRAQRPDAAATLGELLHVRQFALVHPFLDQAWIHAVEAKNDQLLLELLQRPPAAARDGGADRDDEQGEQQAFHRMFGSWKL